MSSQKIKIIKPEKNMGSTSKAVLQKKANQGRVKQNKPAAVPLEFNLNSDLFHPMATSYRHAYFSSLQQTFGNQFVQRMIHNQHIGEIPSIQRQVEEEEEEPIQTKLNDTVQREAEKEEEDILQTKSNKKGEVPKTSPNLEARINATKGGGQPLSERERAFFEHTFNSDFSNVHVHTDAEANKLNIALNARAFTVGKDIFFKQGAYNPDSSNGRELLVHELTHVVQQNNVGEQGKLYVGHPSDRYEQEAVKMERTLIPVVQHKTFENMLQCTNEEGIVKVVKMEPEKTLTPIPHQFVPNARNSIKFVSNRAKINALQYAQQVESACEAFELYSEPKIKDLEDEVTAGELLGVLVTVTLNVVGGGVTGRIASKLGKDIAKAIASQITKKISNKTKDAFSNKDDVKALKNAVKSIAMGARDAATGIQELVGNILDPVINSIVDKLNSNETLLPNEDTLLGMFYNASPGVVDDNLESYLSIPSGKSAKETHIKLFSEMVRKFEEKHIWVQASFRKQVEMEAARRFGATKLTKAYKARLRAQKAAEKRREEIESAVNK